MPNKDQVQGKARELGGAAQAKAGRFTGDEELEARGEVNKAKGKAQKAVGKVKKVADDLKDKTTSR